MAKDTHKLTAAQIKALLQQGGTIGSSSDLSDFYTGGMDPHKPFIAEPGSLPSAYKGTTINSGYPSPTDSPYSGVDKDTYSPGSLTSHKVHTVQVDASGNPIPDVLPLGTRLPSGGPGTFPVSSNHFWGSHLPGSDSSVDVAGALDNNRLGLTGEPTSYEINPALKAIMDNTAGAEGVAAAPVSSAGGGLFGGLLEGAHNAVQTAYNAASPVVSGAVEKYGPAVKDAAIRGAIGTVAGRTALIDPVLGNFMRRMPPNMPQQGQHIQTENHGDQIIGTRLNGSPRGYTVTNSDWFNSVRGL